MAWNDLELKDKARMMQLAVKSGITDLRTIEEVYNKFEEGGHIYDGAKEPTQSIYTQTNSATPFDINKFLAPALKRSEADQTQSLVPLSDKNVQQYYKVVSGDSLGKISKAFNVPIRELLNLNKDTIKNADLIYPGQNILIKNTSQKETPKTRHNIEEENKISSQYTNIDAILNAEHKSNFAIIDKDKQQLVVYSPDKKILTTVPINTGKFNNDYNTKTYVDKNGNLINRAGNMSTPAGITEITSTSLYHGVPAFQRARVNNNNEVNYIRDNNGNLIADNIASALHYEGGVGNPNSSNGCVRLNTKGATELGKYLGVGDRIYTLPQNEGSKFELKDGNLSFTADSPYGKDRDTADKVIINGKEYSKYDWDDYNVTNNLTYHPLEIDIPKDYKLYKDAERWANLLENNKKDLQSKLGITSYRYNKLAKLAMGIGFQESKFGTSNSYRAKQARPISGISEFEPGYGFQQNYPNPTLQDLGKTVMGDTSSPSVGIAQIKYEDDFKNKDLKDIYDKIGVTTSDSDDNSAKATIARLYFIYKNQYLPQKALFENVGLSEDEALAYIYHGGRVSRLRNALESGKNVRDVLVQATPGIVGRLFKRKKAVPLLDYSNKVISNSDKFNYYSTYQYGGQLDKGRAKYPSSLLLVPPPELH